MIALFHILGMVGYVAISIAMIVLARLSQKLGAVTQAKPYYFGLYIAAGLIWFSLVGRLYYLLQGSDVLQAQNSELVYTLISDGLPAIAVTVALVVTWYYWSWLLAERD